MIAVLSDTHSQEGTGLHSGATEAVSTADIVIHAGDFVRESVLDAFEANAHHLCAVYGNVDDNGIRARLPRAQTVTVEGFTIAVVHVVDGGETGLAMFGRECDADLVIFGHTHRPSYHWTGDIGLLNPGSHADPRGNRAAFASLAIEEQTLYGELRELDGTTFERFEIAARDMRED